MARSRNIKPGLYKNERLAECTIWARFLFPGLWLLADRLGRLEDRPRRIGGELLPYDSQNVDGLLDELAQAGLISRYQVDGTRYIQVIAFTKHQSPHVREQASIIPPEFSESPYHRMESPSDQMLTIAESHPSASGSVSSRKQINDIEDSTSLKLRKTIDSSEKNYGLDKFEHAWNAYPKRPGASRPDALKNWIARVKSGANIDDITNGVTRYAAYVIETGIEPKYIKHPSTFFGSGEHYLADWSTLATDAPKMTSRLGKAGQATARNVQQWLEDQSNATN